MAKTILTNINVDHAENGTIVRLSLETMKVGAPVKFDTKEFIFEKTEDAVAFINEKANVLTKTSNQ